MSVFTDWLQVIVLGLWDAGLNLKFYSTAEKSWTVFSGFEVVSGFGMNGQVLIRQHLRPI